MLKNFCLLCGVCTVASLVYFFLLFIDYSNIITYCSLKFLSSCGIILDLLHVLNCDPESRIWRGPGGGSFQRSRGEGGGRAKKKKIYIYFFFGLGLPPPSPPPFISAFIILFADKRLTDLEHSSGCLFKFIVLEKCAEEFLSTLWCLHCGFLGIHFCLLFINYSNIITYCSLKFLSSCDIILDLLHVLNCDPESRIWRGPGGGVLSKEQGGRGGVEPKKKKKKKKFFFFFFFFWLPPPPPPLPLYLPL